MSLESVTYIADLVATNPTATDPKSQGDDHTRNLKKAAKNCFPGFTGAIMVGGTDTGAANAYVLTPSTPLASYTENTMVVWKPTNTNTGASTINISGLGTRAIKTVDGTALMSSDLPAGQYVAMVDNGTEFRIVGITKNYIDQLAFNSALPTGVGRSILVSNGAGAEWVADQTGKAGKFLKTDGAALSWEYVGLTVVGATVTDNYTIPDLTAKIWPCATTAIGKCLTAPAITTSTPLGLFAIIDNSEGSYAVGWRDSVGALAGKNCVGPGGIAHVYLEDNSTAAGVWRIEGTNLEPGLLTIDQTFSSTYTSSILVPYVALDDNTSIHFAERASGFAAFVVDNAGKVLTTPVIVTTTASSLPRAIFKLTSTTAILFFGAGGSDSKAAVLTLSGSSPSYTLSVGTVATLGGTPIASGIAWDGENFVGVPHIAQLTTTLYVASFAVGTPDQCVVAISVSGATVTIGTPLALGVSSIQQSAAIYALTATTALALYVSGSSAPYQVNAVIISVSGTTCAAGTPAVVGNTSNSYIPSSCILSATKALVLTDNNTSTTVRAHAVTISGTSVSVGSALTVESGTGAVVAFTQDGATRHNPHLYPLSANSALLWYLAGSGVSRLVVLTESGGTVTPGAILYNSFSSATSGNGLGMMSAQGTTEFLAIQQEGVSSALSFKAIPHKITGTDITYGASSQRLLGASTSTQIGSGGQGMAARLSGGDYLVNPGTRGYGFSVVRSNGNTAFVRGTIGVPNMAPSGFYPLAVVGNHVVFLGGAYGTTIGASTLPLRLVNVEIAQ